MTKIISIVNQKGGTGKSACTANYGVGLARMKKKVLVVDVDPQFDLSASLGFRDCEGKMDYEYFRIEESEQFSFFRIPKALFTDKEFEVLSTDAKLLYGILLDRISLSKKNGWVDMDGYVYIIYTIAELKALLHMSHATVIKLLHELDTEHGIGLIERYQRGCNRPAIIYVKNFVKPYQTAESVYEVSGIQKNRTPAFKNIESRTSKKLKAGIQKTRSPDFKNIYPSNTDINKTEKNKTDKSKKASRKKENTRLYGRFKNIRSLKTHVDIYVDSL